eukprot:TRINITY_DN9825_c0_g2_i1.p2 TRINITY_DN9825_c0_g2~~TRINITY_DN9825_c0_g2_i1.p2  ORF type:complete len:222 (-),score=16.17 TRINITY_DN9825_c0_g2_i1:564-1229(-)
MSNKQVVALQEVVVEEHQIREVLKCILHTIIFNRALGHVTPRDMHLELINITYADVDDAQIQEKVDKGIQDVHAFLARHRPRPSSAASQQHSDFPFFVTLSFYESIKRQGLVRPYEEKVVWEVWKMQLVLRASDPSTQTKAEREARQQQLQDDVDAVRTCILHNADSLKDHIPPVSDRRTGSLTFPFDITAEHEANFRESILGTVSRLFTQSTTTQPDIMS